MIKQTITLEDKVAQEIAGRLKTGGYNVIECETSAERRSFMTHQTQRVVLQAGEFRIVIEREAIKLPK